MNCVDSGLNLVRQLEPAVRLFSGAIGRSRQSRRAVVLPSNALSISLSVIASASPSSRRISLQRTHPRSVDYRPAPENVGNSDGLFRGSSSLNRSRRKLIVMQQTGARVTPMGPHELTPLLVGLSITTYFFIYPDQPYDLILWVRDLLIDFWSRVA